MVSRVSARIQADAGRYRRPSHVPGRPDSLRRMSTIPEEGELVIRRIPFEFPDDLDPAWNPEQREWSHMVNGASLTMPYLEPFLIKTLRDATALIEDEAILEEARGFIGQEAQHYTTHRRYNELLKAKGYPELADVEEQMQRGYEKLQKRSLTYRLAYASGFETMTLGVTKWLVEDRTKLFVGSDTRIASFIIWHFVEEAEHKRAAFDAFQAASGHYGHRVLGILTGSAHVFWWARKGAIAMLKADGLWRNPRSRLRLWRRTAEFLVAIAPGLLRSALPSHDPRDEPDPEWIRAWIAGYATMDDESPPLVDTSMPDFPIPFPNRGAA